VDVFLGLLPVFMYGWERVWHCSGVVGCGLCVAVGIGATVGVEWGFGRMLWARLACLEWVEVFECWVLGDAVVVVVRGFVLCCALRALTA
jgi:hypothetical protein